MSIVNVKCQIRPTEKELELELAIGKHKQCTARCAIARASSLRSSFRPLQLLTSAVPVGIVLKEHKIINKEIDKMNNRVRTIEYFDCLLDEVFEPNMTDRQEEKSMQQKFRDMEEDFGGWGTSTMFDSLYENPYALAGRGDY